MKFDSDIVIGLEIHISLDTKTKLFCSCPNPKGEEEPNSVTCEVCLGHPGSKPIANKKAIEYITKLASSLKCEIADEVIFSRKTYFYPDLSKNYQITQYETPVGSRGKLILNSGKPIFITRVHLEEDPAALVHPKSISDSPFVLIDYNRSGVPLIEIVTEPVITSPDEARTFMKQLITLLGYLDIFDINTGVIKADANISIRKSGYVRSEIKNINGFKEIERALTYEIERQKNEIKEGRELTCDTRGWDANKGRTFLLRTKETEEDYGYIIDPDLVPISLSEFKKNIDTPELPYEKALRFIKEYSIKEEDAHILCAEKSLGEMYDKVAKKIHPLLAAKWMRRELVRVMNLSDKTFDDLKINENHIIELLKLVYERKITDATAQELLEKLMENPFSPKDYVSKYGLEAVSDLSELNVLCRESIDENPKAVEDYRFGEEKSFNYIVGQVMKKTNGKADPSVVTQILKEMLD